MNKFIVADSANCIGCHACEVACVTSHRQDSWPRQRSDFLPRIRVFFHRHASSATTCRHCNDAPCVGSCPTQALRVANDSVQFTEALCIGCKNCVIACPFGAIEMVANDDDAPQLAQKCDLCSQHPSGQQACVASCPTQALQLMDEAAVNRLRSARQIRSALETPLGTVRGARRSAILNKPPRVGAKKVPADDRMQHFGEIYQPLSECDAEYESERCLYCAQKAWCNWTCPLHNHIPDFIRLVSEGKIIEAAELCHQSSSLPEICGRVCPQDRLCEGACTLKNEGGSVAIGNLERYITDTALAMGWRPTIGTVAPRPERVAVIGAGPAGLGCADILVRAGVHVDVFDRHPEIGGLLTFGIPPFKLDKKVLEKRRDVFSAMGVNFHLNQEVGRDVAFADLVKNYDAVFLGVGTYGLMAAGLEGDNAPGVIQALPFLIASTREVMGLEESPEYPLTDIKGKRVVVLGGGDTAMDCLRTAVRRGAASVTCAYRRDELSMPGSKKEVVNAREEGVKFEFNVQPQRIQLNRKGQVCAVEMIRTKMGEPGPDGRRRPQPIPDSGFELKADVLIMAFGFQAHEMPWLRGHGIKLDRWGQIVTGGKGRGTTQTSHDKIFAGGDAVTGADLVVTAMVAGRQAASEMLMQFTAREEI
ncbi:formate-dependent uric acid utilization protein YgfT [Klebsiella michiganensis]|uniref:formate-dependent uric acid utilization protein YgfT n=1 Tax=Klebsiella michiganensis TaxID=1134687 RepID=UPI00101FAC0B|nr:formate-dependent uric acid utilization protein YgfT [Klebsiella michiganensis]EKQ6536654.1 formate-dependent uric acid utilization protein YgfT [Klebsiella michiganensis]ELQ7988488.1 formate-dependent uric acid utilization protein YgfT [Klebsiella michiganensis]MCW9597210.1 formate-dependent uric acid utilization protein YgfT [Klebsiella michiganensis]